MAYPFLPEPSTGQPKPSGAAGPVMLLARQINKDVCDEAARETDPPGTAPAPTPGVIVVCSPSDEGVAAPVTPATTPAAAGPEPEPKKPEEGEEEPEQEAPPAVDTTSSVPSIPLGRGDDDGEEEEEAAAAVPIGPPAPAAPAPVPSAAPATAPAVAEGEQGDDEEEEAAATAPAGPRAATAPILAPATEAELGEQLQQPQQPAVAASAPVAVVVPTPALPCPVVAAAAAAGVDEAEEEEKESSIWAGLGHLDGSETTGLRPTNAEAVGKWWGEAVAAVWRAAEEAPVRSAAAVAAAAGPLLPMAMEVALDPAGLVPPPAPHPPLQPAVVGTFVNQHGETVGLLDDNPAGLPVVLLPTEEELRRV